MTLPTNPSPVPNSPGQLYVTGIGFWLPTDEAAFFHQDARHHHFVAHHKLAVE